MNNDRIQGYINDINRRQMSFGDIDEQQTQYVLLVIDAWRNQNIHVLEVRHYLDDIVRDELTPEKIEILKNGNQNQYDFWETTLINYRKDYRDGLTDTDQQDNIHGALTNIEQRLKSHWKPFAVTIRRIIFKVMAEAMANTMKRQGHI